MMKSVRYIAVSLAAGLLALDSLAPASACEPWYYAPQEYYMYRASADHMHRSYSYDPRELNWENCSLWQMQTSGDISTSDIWDAVYKVPAAQIQRIVDKDFAEDVFLYRGEKNAFLEWLAKDEEAAVFLLLAKQCEETRDKIASPWYYPSKNDPVAKALEDIADRAIAYKDERFLSRYALQAERALLTLRRYEDGVRYWESVRDKLPADALYTLSLHNVAGCYYGLGDLDTAKDIYISIGDVGSYYDCFPQQKKTGLEEIYQICPDAPYLRDLVRNNILGWEQSIWDGDWYDKYVDRFIPLNDKDVEFFHDFCLRLAREGRVSDPDFWYYSAAFIEHMGGDNAVAKKTVAKALKAKGSSFIKDSARVLQIYLEAQDTCNGSYENRMLTHVRWLEGKILEDLDNARESIRSGYFYYANGNMSCYYWNDMLRKVVLGAVCPNLLKAGKDVSALAFANMAENMLVSRVNEMHSWNREEPMTLKEFRESEFFNYKDYCSDFFEMADTLSVDNVIKYYEMTVAPRGELQWYLNERGYTDKDYLCDLIGSKMLREMRYAEAERWLGAVSGNYQGHLNTDREGFLTEDPFAQEKRHLADPSDYKYNFAREMASLERGIESTKDPNRKASLMARYATGMKNSVGNCWALCFYHIFADFDIEKEWRPYTYFSEKQKAAFSRVESLYAEALRLCTNPETAARIQFYLGNNKTVVEQYPDTRTAAYIRARCDTYDDYHFDVRKNYWRSYLYAN